MSYAAPEQFANVTVACKANIYFDGKVVSHGLTLADGSRKTLGLIFPGSFKFNTAAAEKMEIVSGACTVRIAGRGDWVGFSAGTWFEVPADSFFEISVDRGITEYICSFA